MVSDKLRLSKIEDVTDFFVETAWGAMLHFAGEVHKSLKSCAEFNRRFGKLNFDQRYAKNQELGISLGVYSALRDYGMGMALQVAEQLNKRGQGLCARCRMVFPQSDLKSATAIEYDESPGSLLHNAICQVQPLCQNCHPNFDENYQMGRPSRCNWQLWFRPVGSRGPLDIHIPFYQGIQSLPLPEYANGFIPRIHDSGDLKKWGVRVKIMHSACDTMLKVMGLPTHVCLDDNSGPEIHAYLNELK